MELVTGQVDGGKLGVADLDLLGVVVFVELGVDLQACAGGRCGDRVDHDLVAGQRASAPGLGDVAEQPMLDLVPLRGAGREVADPDLKAGGIGELLQLKLP